MYIQLFACVWQLIFRLVALHRDLYKLDIQRVGCEGVVAELKCEVLRSATYSTRAATEVVTSV